MPGYYAVSCGRQPGVYDHWQDAREQTFQHPYGHCKKFEVFGDALAYLGETVDSDLQYRLEFDGASRGCPGATWNAGAGAVLYVEGDYGGWERVGEISSRLGNVTSQQAEYAAFLLGIEAAWDIGVENLSVCGDSQLVVEQILGNWHVRSSRIWPLYDRARDVVCHFDNLQLHHTNRENNQQADDLANAAINGYGWDGLKSMKGNIMTMPREDLPFTS